MQNSCIIEWHESCEVIFYLTNFYFWSLRDQFDQDNLYELVMLPTIL